MEQKKTLWIIAAVGVFLIVCFGVAYLIINNPNENYEGTTTSISATDNRNIDNGWTSPANYSEIIKENQTSEENEQADSNFQNVNDVYVVANNATVVGLNTNEGTTIDLMTLGNNAAPSVTANEVIKEKNNDKVEVIKETESKNEAIEYYTGTPSEAAKNEKKNSVKQYSTPAKNNTSVSTKSTSNNSNTNTTKSSSNTTKSSSSTTTKTTVNSNKTVTRYWVQVSSYQNKKTAENARTVLNDNKIPSDIFTYQDNSNKLFYRVRVGPYTSKSEAEYWMSKINLIKDFTDAQSYVTSTVDK